MSNKVTIIGAGLAGSEAAWQIAEAGQRVELYEMRPKLMTKAHKTDKFAELVCSNSFRGAALNNAVGLLKEELKSLNSLIMLAAEYAKVPAGGALAVDREVFSDFITSKIKNHPNIKALNEEVNSIPEASIDTPVIIATGPLTSHSLANKILELTGEKSLSFYDAISPVLFYESIDHEKVYRKSRYDKGDGADYLNVPLSKDEYLNFISEVKNAEKYSGNEDVESDDIEGLRPFEGCMPIEDMIERGDDTLRFGPFKPVGLEHPKTGEMPYAVLQLRQDNKEGSLWNMVGMQTRMKHGEQMRIFSMLAGLEKAEFARLGSVHRNTFIDSPKCLNNTLEYKNKPGLFFAGQITGVEGYVESTAGGLVAGVNASRLLSGHKTISFPKDTAIGGLLNYISEEGKNDFQPMNINFGLIESYGKIPKKRGVKKNERRVQAAEMALKTLAEFKETRL